MTVKITITDPFKPVVHKNQYELLIDYMHGDADAYSDESYFFDANDAGLDGLQRTVDLISEFADADVWGSGESREWLEENGSRFGFDADGVESFIDCYTQHDSTDGSYSNWAQFDGFTVFYYDEHGTKYNTSITRNGKDVYQPQADDE